MSFTREFKLEAVRLLELKEKPTAQLARDLGLRRNQLYKWQKELKLKGFEDAFRGSGRNASINNLSELERLRRRVANLEEENEILKKADAYFAKKQS